MNGEAAIVAERLRVIRGRRVALDDLTVEVRGGAVTGLLGPSGSGKSTLMRAVVGVQKSTSGDVRAATISFRPRSIARTR